MRYCSQCGKVMDDQDMFCSHCGASAGNHTGTQYHPNSTIFTRERGEKFLCELAYSGVLFWLPLLVSGKVKTAKYHANQGLWMLILSCISCWCIQLFGFVNLLLTGVVGVVFHVIYGGIFLTCMLVLLYLAAQGIRNALAIHRGEEAVPILFFEKEAIIR